MFCGITFNSSGLICSFCLHSTSHSIPSHSLVIEKFNPQMQLQRQSIIPLRLLKFSYIFSERLSYFSLVLFLLQIYSLDINNLKDKSKKTVKIEIGMNERAVVAA